MLNGGCRKMKVNARGCGESTNVKWLEDKRGEMIKEHYLWQRL
jgi:hypothetical protein